MSRSCQEIFYSKRQPGNPIVNRAFTFMTFRKYLFLLVSFYQRDIIFGLILLNLPDVFE